MKNHNDAKVEGGSLTCPCGLRYHVSVFHEVLRVIADEAYGMARLDRKSIMDLAIERGYRSGDHPEQRRLTDTENTEHLLGGREENTP